MIILKLTKHCISSCSHQGECKYDVEAWVTKPIIARQLAKIDKQEAIRFLEEFGAWSPEELEDHSANLERILWIACGNAREQIASKEQCPCTVYLE